MQLLWIIRIAAVYAQDSSQEVVTLTGTDRRITGADAEGTVSVPSDFEGSSIPTGTISGVVSGTMASNATASITSTQSPLTQVIGGTRTTGISGNMTTTTSTASQPSNTQPCNNYPELCTRRYSNITEVAAHNSPFVRQNNAASNQVLDVTHQLNDGIRVLQGQAHYVNGTLYYCHTSCDLLNAGTVEDYLRTVTAWVATHPFDVITIIFGNANWQDKDSNGSALVTSQNFADPIEQSGLKKYIYQPPKTAMTLEDWPTLGELIIEGKRVITFIDYNFDTNAVPYMLWEYYNMWETPFSPTDSNFPCTLGRPDGIGEEKMSEMMYIANHNLNVEVSIGGASLLIPNTVELNVTNGINGNGSLGLMANQCTGKVPSPDDVGKPILMLM